ncbi:MAG: HNH endonuclease [Candidatus Krumholzibacteria bacterium]|nr:HNH endonuclease [Candidatus Krumholzibacteria bacterium]
MPPKFVKTIREEILYEYAKLISRSAFRGGLERAFVTDRFKELRDGHITVSGTNREWQREQELPKLCVFCGSEGELQADHLIPRSRGGKDESDNLVLSCRTCNASRGDKGVFEWLGLEKKDSLHRLVAGKYLKQLHDLHEARETLSIDRVTLVQLCPSCKNKHACIEWNKVEELTCFCLESIF